MKKKRDHKWMAAVMAAALSMALFTGCAVPAASAMPGTSGAEGTSAIPEEERTEAVPAEEVSAVSSAAENSGREAFADGPYGRITVSVPDGWNWTAVQNGSTNGSADPAITGLYGLILTPEAMKSGHLELFYEEMFGVCGTGLAETETELAGDQAVIGTYDGHAMWDFIIYKGVNEGIQAVAVSDGQEEWPEAVQEEAMQILDTLRFDPGQASGGAGYFRPEAEEPAIGLMVEAADITGTGAAVRFRRYDPDASTGELYYGQDFVLEKLEDGTWEPLPQLVENAVFTEEAYPIPSGGMDAEAGGTEDAVCQVDWDWLYGTISPGDYRIGKRVIDSRSPGDFDAYMLYAFFRYAGEPDLIPMTDDGQQGDAAGMDPQAYLESEAHWKWWEEMRDKIDRSAALQDGMPAYYTAVMDKLLASEEGENTVCAPLNIYLALAMLAEVSDGETRQQVLDALQAADMDVLRDRADALYAANLADTPILQSLPAASMWLRDDIGYEEETLGKLADIYHSESFTGRPGSAEMNEALRAWTDEKTGGLLSEYTKDLELDRDTVLALITTMYYKAAWIERFRPEDTERGVFHGTGGDTEKDMMHRSFASTLYRADGFSAVGLGLSDSGSMYFLLPEEGTDVEAVLASPALAGFCDPAGADAYLESTYALVEMTVPKFSIRQRTDLTGALKALGITDAFDPDVSDFRPLTSEVDSIYVSKAEHSALVEIDEEGVTGAAYTELAMAAGAALMPETVEFTLDRPFIFLVTARDGSVLFAGCVRN